RTSRPYTKMHTDIFANEQSHAITSIYPTKRNAMPPPLPNILHTQAKIKLAWMRGIITIAQPRQGTNTCILLYLTRIGRCTNTRRWHISLVPLRAHFILVIDILLTILHSYRGQIVATSDDYWPVP